MQVRLDHHEQRFVVGEVVADDRRYARALQLLKHLDAVVTREYLVAVFADWPHDDGHEHAAGLDTLDEVVKMLAVVEAEGVDGEGREGVEEEVGDGRVVGLSLLVVSLIIMPLPHIRIAFHNTS